MFGFDSVRRYSGGTRAGWRAAIVGLALLVGACSSLTPTLVSPTLNPDAVRTTVAQHQELMNALQADADVIGYVSTDWYEVTLAGFNYVDDQCAVYFDSLFAFNRRASAIKSGIGLFDKTSAAIMQIAGTATVTMSVIAQVFGLAGSMTDVVAGTFLYDLPPANTQRFVQKTMGAYKTAASDNRSTINSRASAYSTIRGYLNLCLPVTIEGLLIDRISDTKPKAEADGPGTNIEVDVRASASTGLSADVRLPAVVDRVPSSAGLNWTEQHIEPADWRKIQRAICLPEDGIPGSATHAAMMEFFEGRGEPDPNIVTGGIGTVQLSVLSGVVSDSNGRTCPEGANAFEVGKASK